MLQLAGLGSGLNELGMQSNKLGNQRPPYMSTSTASFQLSSTTCTIQGVQGSQLKGVVDTLWVIPMHSRQWKTGK